MDYCAKESTLNSIPCDEAIREQTIKMSIQETYKILGDMNATLQEFAKIVNGKENGDNVPKNAGSLWEESRLMVALAYENLQKLNEIKRSII